MLKIEKEYLEKYGDIPNDNIARLDALLNSFNSLSSLRGKIFKTIKKINNIKWEEISYTIYLVPKSTPRPRLSSRSNTFYVKGSSDNKKLMREFMKNENFRIIKTACEFRSVAYLPIPNSMNNLEKLIAELGYIRPISIPDFDNLAKTYTDMIKGLILYDDALIISGTSDKYYSTKPRIEITICYMTDYDSNYNKRKYYKK